MLLSTTTTTIEKLVGLEQTLTIFADAGFDAFDMSFTSMERNEDHPMRRDDWRDFLRSVKSLSDRLQLPCNQSHAPFSPAYGNPETREAFFERTLRAIEGAAYLGARIIVVHPLHHVPYWENREELIRFNQGFFERLIPYAEKWDISLALENMFQRRDGKIVGSICSTPEDFRFYMDLLSHKRIVACLDLGHAILAEQEIGDMAAALGKKLCALHVQDNDLVNDLHTLPFLGKIDYEKAVSDLVQNGYEGDFTFESCYFFRNMPKEMLPAAARLMHDCGRYFMSKFEKE